MKLGITHAPDKHTSFIHLEDVPAGITIDQDQIYADLARSLGLFKHVATLKKLFSLQIRGSIHRGVSFGGPVSIELCNNALSSSVCTLQAKSLECGPLLLDVPEYLDTSLIRPNSKDLASALVRGSEALDFERSIAFVQRLCALSVGASLARELLAALSIRMASCISGINQVRKAVHIRAVDLLAAEPLVLEEDEICCPFADMKPQLLEAYKTAHEASLPLVGQISIAVDGLPLGLGLPTRGELLSAAVARSLFGLSECREVSFGSTDKIAEGLDDERVYANGRVSYVHNYLGGLESGVSSGDPLLVHALVLPQATGFAQLFDLATHTSILTSKSTCTLQELISLRYMAEAQISIALAGLIQNTYAAHSLNELKCRLYYEEQQIASRLSSGVEA